MSLLIDLFEDSGTPSASRGSVITLIDQWNMKNSSNPAVVYFPTGETTNAPLVRPTGAGEEFLSFKKYLSFKCYGTYANIKNLKINLSVDSATQANKPRLFYKFANTYSAPDNAYDGDMICASIDGTVQVPTLFPCFSTTGPQNATTRQAAYGPDQILYSNWLVLQMRIPYDCSVGNSAEFKLTLSASEYK